MIELMVVVVIIGLLAAVAIPKYGDLLEKANLGATLGNLASIRSAVSIYYSNRMAYPETIDGNILETGVPYVKATKPSSNSPYGNAVEVTGLAGIVPTAMGKGWFYDSGDGYIFINSVANDIKGQCYTTY